MEEAKWYVIHTYAGYEAMVQDSLLQLIENNNLQDKILKIKIPTEETLEEKANGKKKVVERNVLGKRLLYGFQGADRISVLNLERAKKECDHAPERKREQSVGV